MSQIIVKECHKCPLSTPSSRLRPHRIPTHPAISPNIHLYFYRYCRSTRCCHHRRLAVGKCRSRLYVRIITFSSPRTRMTTGASSWSSASTFLFPMSQHHRNRYRTSRRSFNNTIQVSCIRVSIHPHLSHSHPRRLKLHRRGFNRPTDRRWAATSVL